jgi:alanyl-tRNA synthetase
MRTEGGVEELKQKNVDFGGGLERMAAAVNDDSDVFNLDVFDNAKNIIEKISGEKYENENVYAYRVILDHMRAATFLVGDGVFPGNKDQQYFVRRLIRRAVRFAKKLNINENFTSGVVQSFIDVYSDEYKNLKEKNDEIKKIIDDEESKFRKTLENGLKEFEKYATGNISGDNAFNLLQSFGFPIELTEELAKEKGVSVEMDKFKVLKDAHSEASRTASAGKFKGGLGGDSEMETKYHTATHMLHKALHMVLGEGATQKGSNITTERLRFDFAFERKLTPEEIKKVEDIVNENIQKDLNVTRSEMTLDEAKNMGAIGLFGDKYGEKVSVYAVDGFSLELCGGPHVTHTGDMGVFKIVKEEAVSAGVRRIKATLS